MSIPETNTKAGSIDPDIHQSLWKALHGKSGADNQPAARFVANDMGDDYLFAEAFREELIQLDRNFPENTIPFISKNQPGLYHQINEIESKLNIIWIKESSGHCDLVKFREILSEWRRLHLVAAEIYAGHCQDIIKQ